MCFALVSLLLWLSVCGSRAIPEVVPQDGPTSTPEPPTNPPAPEPTATQTPTVTPVPTITATPTPIKESSSQFDQTPLPDLAVKGGASVGFNPGTCGWDGGQITVSFENIGIADAGPFAVSIQGDVVRLDGLSAGAVADASGQFNSVLSGITAKVDSADEVVESNETNNSIGATFTPPPTCTSTPPSIATWTATPEP